MPLTGWTVRLKPDAVRLALYVFRLTPSSRCRL